MQVVKGWMLLLCYSPLMVNNLVVCYYELVALFVYFVFARTEKKELRETAGNKRETTGTDKNERK
jgi:hypothetical protein